MNCDICYNDKKDMYMCKCGMHYCNRCILDIIISYEFKCTNCHKHIKLSKIMELMSRENMVAILVNKYKNNISTFKSAWFKMFKYDVLTCNKCNNNLSYRKPNYYCEHCKEDICFVCLNHHDEMCCKKSDFDEYCKNVKHCPNCMFKIFRSRGCDQMYCTNCRTGFNWNTGKKIDKYFENPERSNVLSRDNNYIEMNDDVKQTYESESYEFIIRLYNNIVKNKTYFLDKIDSILQNKSPIVKRGITLQNDPSFTIIDFMNYYINYKLKIKTLKVIHRNLYLYETIRETHLSLEQTVYNLIDELLNLKYKYIEEIDNKKIIKLPIINQKEINELKEAGLYEYFIRCIIKINRSIQSDLNDHAGTTLLSKYYGERITVPY